MRRYGIHNLGVIGLDSMGNGALGGWLLRDEFTTALGAGAVNGTVCEPGPGTRVVVDSTGKLSLTGGSVSFSGGITSWGDPGLWLSPSVAREVGRLVIMEHTRTSLSGNTVAGMKQTAAAGTFTEYFQFSNGPLYASKPTGIIRVGTYAIGQFFVCIALRASGSLFFLKTGITGKWKLKYPGTAGAIDPMFVGMSSFNDDFTSDYLRVPASKWLPAPIASDGMSVLATTDGLGHAEGVSEAIGSGGSGVAWANTLGTWQVAAGVASASALSGGEAIRTVQSTTADVFIECDLTRSAGNLGLVLRYTDSNNYVYLYHEGTNITLRKVVGGVDSEVLAPTAAPYGAGRRISVSADGTAFLIFYNDLAIGAAQTIADAALQDGLLVGLYTTNTGNTFDNFIVRAIGNDGENDQIDAYG